MLVRNRVEWEIRVISKETVYKLRLFTRRSRVVGLGIFVVFRI